MMLELPALPDVFGNYSLRGFEEIAAPASISWFPTTIGWQLLGLLLLALLCRKAYLAVRNWLRNRYRGEAHEALVEIASQAPTSAQLAAVNRILKSTALQAFPRGEIAGLSGHSWLKWLNANGGGARFSEESSSLLGTGQYQMATDISDAQWQGLMAESREWVSRHPGPGDA